MFISAPAPAPAPAGQPTRQRALWHRLGLAVCCAVMLAGAAPGRGDALHTSTVPATGDARADPSRMLAGCTGDLAARDVCAARFLEHCLATDGSRGGLIACALTLADYWEEAMNSYYRQLLAHADRAFGSSLRSGQQTWDAWRHQRCRPWLAMHGGMYRLVAANCEVQTVRERAADLDQLLAAMALGE